MTDASSSIQNAHQQQASTTLASASGNDSSAPAPTQPSPIDDSHRVYIAGLAPDTTEEQLKTTFSSVGTVISVSVPKRRNFRNRRNAGKAEGQQQQQQQTPQTVIAFVGYATESEANNAVSSLNGTEVAGHEITVAMAKPLSERKPRPLRQKKTAHETQAAGEGQETARDVNLPGQADGVEGGAATKKSSKRGPRGKKTNGVTSGENVTPAGTVPDAGTEAAAAGSETASTNTRRQPREPKQRGPPADGKPSEKTLFVAGLSYDTTDEELKSLFADYNPQTAHVALRPIPISMVKRLQAKGERRKGRGFGFVTFQDVESQQAALNALNGKKLDNGNRELVVKVAIDAPKPASTESPATAEAA
ncbi:hypothetical protein PYCC9005_004491 [Savitreella phatthalungensis]